MASRGRVIVVGSSNTDLVCQCAKLPQAGETVLGGDLRTFAGGKGANQAVGAARAGAKVSFIGAFGDDAFGRARRADLEKEGIDCSGCVVKKGVSSGVALIGIGEGRKHAKAENLIIVAPGANARLTPADLKKAMPKPGRGDVVLCSLEVPFDTIETALRLAVTHGALALLNTAPFPPAGLPASLLKWAAAITPNETEAAALLGANLESVAALARLQELMKAGCAHIIVTRGAKGARYFHAADSKDGLAHADVAAPKVKPVDTVGAGDCFNGSLAAYLADRPDEFEAGLKYAVAAAALKVTRQGAQAGMPRRAEVLKLMKRAK